MQLIIFIELKDVKCLYFLNLSSHMAWLKEFCQMRLSLSPLDHMIHLSKI